MDSRSGCTPLTYVCGARRVADSLRAQLRRCIDVERRMSKCLSGARTSALREFMTPLAETLSVIDEVCAGLAPTLCWCNVSLTHALTHSRTLTH